MLDKISLFEIGITNAFKEEVLEYIEKSLKEKQEKYYIVTPNPELVMIARENPSYKNILNNAHLALCDGVGLLVASRFLGKPVKERITGVDFMLELCSWFAKKPITVGLLGGKPGVAEKVSECLHQQFPQLKISFVAQEWDSNSDLPHAARDAHVMGSYTKISRSLSESRHRKDAHYSEKNASTFSSLAGGQISIKDIDILFVAFGSPKQEEWIAQNLESLPVRVVMGVGGAFDFIAGTVPRASLFVRSLGLEWFFRLIRQPWRIKRQRALLKFAIMVIREKIKPTK